MTEFSSPQQPQPPSAAQPPFPGYPAGGPQPLPSAWGTHPPFPVAPSMTRPILIGGGVGVVVGGMLGIVSAWVLMAIGLEDQGLDFSDVDGGKFTSLLMLFAVGGGIFLGVVGLIIGLVVGSSRKSRHNGAYAPQPQPWQYPTGPQTQQQPFPTQEHRQQ